MEDESFVYYNHKKWKEYPTYYRYIETESENGNFLTIGFKQSKKCRVTGSIVNKCINQYSNKHLVARQIAGIYNETLSEEMMEKINYGILHENDAREWYKKVTGNMILPSFFGVYKINNYLGAEHDGFVADNERNELDGIIEIKCPMQMYPKLDNYKPSENINYSHISESHFDQMQMEMEIFDKSWCDYIVFCIPENKVHLERVYRDRYHWTVMYEKIEIFVNGKLKPLLKEIGSDYPLNPN